MTTADPLLRFRDRFPILKRTKYLVSHSLGAMPEATRDALAEYADLWATRGVRAWGDKWWMMSVEIGDILAPLIGAPRGSAPQRALDPMRERTRPVPLAHFLLESSFMIDTAPIARRCRDVGATLVLDIF